MKEILYNGLWINAMEEADVDKLLKTLKGKRFVIPKEIDGIIVQGVMSGSFQGISGINSIVFPEGLVYVQSEAITECDVEELIFRENLELFKIDELRTNKQLTCIQVAYGCKSYKTIQGNLYNGDGSTLMYGFNNKISEGTIRIGDNAFAESNIEFVNLPKEISSIGINAFFKCEQLKGVQINGNNLDCIEGSAFEQCKKLKRIVIPNSVGNIYSAAFRDSGLEELRFGEGKGSSQLRISIWAFMNTNLKVVDFSNITHLIVEDEAFMSANVKSLTLEGYLYLEDNAFHSNCDIESLTLKSISVEIPVLRQMREPFGSDSTALIALISKHNNKHDETTYVRHNKAWVEEMYW